MIIKHDPDQNYDPRFEEGYRGPQEIGITETMEQVQRHVEKYLALHRELLDEREVLALAVNERWGSVDPAALLFKAELNSLVVARAKMLANPKKNRWVDTNVQGDMFNATSVKVPQVLVIDGKPRPYYEASVLDGLEWWRARQDAKKDEASTFRAAADQRDADSVEAAAEAEKLEAIVRKAMDNGIDPRTVKYAKAPD